LLTVALVIVFVPLPAFAKLTAIVPVLFPFFLIDMADGFAEIVQFDAPVPVIGGATMPVEVVQSAVLLCVPAPDTTALETTSLVPLTVV
jgi:hypothetical protein